ncbi:pilus assembly protein TadE [Serinicoccus sp. CUA-874]|uniref:TadE family type IV pilus minor pilin n=1 Tax=Serinicoccus sp. CUA-874 TaxID=1517939 RepID=UPI00095C7719|nr:TadE family type IV pilus minor pilin [Serinicoccus sp. CUA-874]OLT18340.1 pilus assembly protein TadE [Serinicoccus sp. CUA-874]
MVSAELALTVPAVLLVLAICLTALSLGVDQVRCEDAARVAARAASRGEETAVVEQLARDRAPEGSSVVLGRDAEAVTVEVHAPSRARLLPALPAAHASARAVWEPGAAP